MSGFLRILVMGLSLCLVVGCGKKDGGGGGGSEPNANPDGGETDTTDEGTDSKDDGTTDDGGDDGAVQGPGSLAVTGDLGAAANGQTVYALPLSDGSPKSAATLDAPATQVDGPFTLQIVGEGANLTQDNGESQGPQGHVLIVTDDTKPRLDQADDVKFLVMPVGNEELIGLPTGEAKGEEIKLGTLKAGDDGFNADTSNGESPFTTEEGILNQMARVDDAVRVAKNAYINANPESKVASDGSVVFHWKSKLTQALIADAPAAPSHNNTDIAAGSPLFMGYGIRVETTHPAFAFDKFCQGGDYAKIGFLPPTAGLDAADHCADTSTTAIDERWPCIISSHDEPTVDGEGFQHAFTHNPTNGNPYGPTEVFTSDNSCLYFWPVPGGSTKYSIGVEHHAGEDADTKHVLSFGGPLLFKGDVVPGLWQITVDDTPIAKFDLAVASPYRKPTIETTEYNFPNVYVPTFSLTRNSENVVTGALISLWLYKFDAEAPASSKFERVTDLGTAQRVVRNLNIGISSNDGGTDVGSRTQVFGSVDWDNATIDAGVITVPMEGVDVFVLPNKGDSYDAAKKLIWSAFVNYEMFGTSYEFGWGCDTTQDVECAN